MRTTEFREFFQQHPDLAEYVKTTHYANERDWEILQDHCFRGMTMTDTARKHGIGRDRVNQILTRFIKVAACKKQVKNDQ